MINLLDVFGKLKGKKTKIGIGGILIVKALLTEGVPVPVWVIPVLIAWTGPSVIGHVDRWIDKFKNG